MVSIASRGASWGVYPSHHRSGSPWVKSQLEAGGIQSTGVNPKGFRCVPNSWTKWLILQSVWESFCWVKKWTFNMTFWSKTLPATFFLANTGRLSFRNGKPNQQRWGFAVSWRQDWRFREWKEEKPQWNTQTHGPRACFRYALTRTPAEEPKKISIDSPISPSHVFRLRAILGARKAGTVSNVGVSLERDKMTEPNATILDHELCVCHPRSSA